MPSIEDLAAQVAADRARVTAHLDGTGPELSLEELHDAHRAMRLAIAAGVTGSDVRRHP